MNSTLITDEELNSINQALLNRYGLDFTDYELSSFKRRVVRIMHKNNFENILQLWRKLLYDAEFASYFKDEISVGLTEMFRNPQVWSYLRDSYFSKFKYNDSISIWHAGCSTGEEYYSMCILLSEINKLNQAEIFVTDLSDKFIKLTQKGEYDLDLLEKYKGNYKLYNTYGFFNLYYTKFEKTGIFKQTIKPKTEFKQHNLVSERMDKRFDIIFCRNVMIYFNDSLKMKVLEMFYENLKPNGVLVIGHFDALPQNFNIYFDYLSPELKIFKKIKQP